MHLKSTTTVEEIFENYLYEVAKMHLKSSTMGSQSFEKYLSDGVKNT